MAAVRKIDSNFTGLRIAEEASLQVLPATPVWVPYEPNSYTDFGGTVGKVARDPINSGRQNQKGVAVDLDVAGGFQTDLTPRNLRELLQGHFFADLRRQSDTTPDGFLITSVDGSAETYTLDTRQAASAVVAAGGTGYAVNDIVTISGGTFTTAATFRVTAVTGGVVDTVALETPGRYSTVPSNPASTTGGGGSGLTLTVTYANALTFLVGQLLWVEGLDDPANNGLKRVTAVTNNILTVAQNLVTDASPAAAATLRVVGVQGTAGDLDVSSPGGQFPAITSTSLNFTTLGLVPGQWIFVGGDSAALGFATAANNGFARVRSVSANTLILDKTSAAMVTEASTTETVQIFFGHVLKNEVDTTIVRRTYSIERTLGAPDDAIPAEVQAEYLDGSVPNTAVFNFDTAAKITVDLTWVPLDNAQIDGPTALRSGTRPNVDSSGDAFNTSNDFSRLKMNVISDTNSFPSALFAFLEEFTLTVDNRVTPNKAISVFGAFDATAGNFTVSGQATAYFSTVEAVASVRNNDDVTIDWVLVNGPTGAKRGIAIDVPLISLGDGRLNVVKDEAIKLPLSMDAAADRVFDHTLLFTFFDYLPNAADA